MVAGETAAFMFRGDDWWGATPRRDFHFVSGGSPSRQQDALLHGTVGYHTSRFAASVWRWACVSPETAAWLGALTGFAIGLPKEIRDGFHNGFSIDDMAATGMGALLPALHQSWRATRIVTLKFLYLPSEEYRNRIGGLPQMENDYAGQRFFLSINPARAFDTGWPRWLGVAVGHSVDNWVSAVPHDEWYVALDLDFAGLPIDGGWWRSLASWLDQVHFPGPGLMMSQGTVRFGLF